MPACRHPAPPFLTLEVCENFLYELKAGPAGAGRAATGTGYAEFRRRTVRLSING